MIHPVDILLTLVLLSVLFSFASSRLPVLIRIIAFQGVVVSIVPFFLEHDMAAGSVVFTVATLTIRGIIIPWSIYSMIKKMSIKREMETVVGYNVSVFFSLLLIVAAPMLSHKFNLPLFSGSTLITPTAITLVVAGMFLLMARRNAIAMVLGYIMMENGIYLVGTSFSARTQHIVEFGILLDVLAGVMIMAIMLQSMKQKYDNLDTALLRELKE
ncbi:MAG: NADH-quinone oxidoreductase subunit K [Desulfobacteraceae bacterium]|jgi:hydrogenase-4 component E|nr:NADH-quinone oxidoreductase subunit K [Desulfobacteraceae bacterium]